MRARLTTLIPIIAIVMLFQAPAESPTKWALIIGISRYENAPTLAYAARDAASFADFLRSPRGGEIPPENVFTLLDQATNTEILAKFGKFKKLVKPGDTVYVYISGHGLVDETDMGFFIPSNGDMKEPDGNSVSFVELKDYVENAMKAANLRVFILDICHSGAIDQRDQKMLRVLKDTVSEDVLRKLFPGGTLINLMSSKPYEESFELADFKAGAFTHTLLEGLNGAVSVPDKIVRAGELMTYLAEKVPEFSAGNQNPVANTSPLFNKDTPLSFLEKQGPAPVGPGLITSLAISNTARTPYLRMEWLESKTDSKFSRKIPKVVEPVEVALLDPGQIDIRVFDAQNKESVIPITLREGRNILDLTARSLVGEVIQIASVSPTSLPQSVIPPVSPQAELLLRAPIETEIYVDQDFMGSGNGNARLVRMPGISPGAHNVRLVAGSDREYRFRLTLRPGPQLFEWETGELRMLDFVRVPAQIPVPVGIPAALQQPYRQFQQALFEERLINPAGNSALDYFTQIRDAVSAPIRDAMQEQLAVAMGDRAQRTLARYIRGGDLRWNAAVFRESETLIDRAQQLLFADPSFDSLREFFNGRALIEENRFDEAVQALQRSNGLIGRASHVQNAIGLAYWEQNRFSEAIPPLQRAIAATPQWSYPRLTLALVYLEQRRYAEAEQTFRAAIQTNPADSSAYHGLGQLLLLLNRMNEVEPLLQQAILYGPGNAYAHDTYGKWYQRRGQLDQAEAMFRLAIRLEPDEPAFRLSLAELLSQRGQNANAQALYAAVASQADDNMQVLTSYTAFLAGQQRVAEARTIFEQSARKYPKDANRLVAYAGFLARQGLDRDAEGRYRAAIKLSPTNAFAHHGLASLYLKQHQLQAAEKELAAATAADPLFGAPPKVLGQIRFAQKKYGEALDQFRQALQLSIDVNEQQELRASVAESERLEVAGKLDEAAKAIAARRYPSAWSQYAAALKASPDSRALRDAVLQFQDLHPEDADVSQLPSNLSTVLGTSFWRDHIRAEILWRSGQKQQAMDLFAAALSGLSSTDFRKVSATAFNLKNDNYSVHQVVIRWAQRLLDEKNPAGAIELMDAAMSKRVFGIIPNFSPLTIDSLMSPDDGADPRELKDFEVAYNPDRGAHGIYVAAYTALGNTQKALEYGKAIQ